MTAQGQRLACSLGQEELAERRRELRDALAGQVSELRRDPAAVRFEPSYSRPLHERLARLVELERACCPFLELALEHEGGRLVLTITAPPGAGAALDVFAETAAGNPAQAG